MSTDTIARPDAKIDLEKLREKYRAERDKRLRPVGTDQYNFAEGKFAQFDRDPYAGPPIVRDALHETLDALVIGTGLGGFKSPQPSDAPESIIFGSSM